MPHLHHKSLAALLGRWVLRRGRRRATGPVAVEPAALAQAADVGAAEAQEVQNDGQIREPQKGTKRTNKWVKHGETMS